MVSHGGHLIDKQVGQYIKVALKTLVALRTMHQRVSLLTYNIIIILSIVDVITGPEKINSSSKGRIF